MLSDVFVSAKHTSQSWNSSLSATFKLVLQTCLFNRLLTSDVLSAGKRTSVHFSLFTSEYK